MVIGRVKTWWRRRRYTTYKMRKTIVAFDCDGTLIKSGAWSDPSKIEPNQRIVDLLIILASFKNVRIVVWSGSGLDWANLVTDRLGLRKHVWRTYDKNLTGKSPDGETWYFEPPIKPDIAIDDIQACSLGVLNLIVREK